MATGKRIKHYREARGWTLQQLSDKSGVDLGTISALEVRDSCRSKFFAPIANAFGLTVDQLADENVNYPVDPTPKTPSYPPVSDSGALILKDHRVTAYTPPTDKWLQAAIDIMTELDPGQKQAMVSKMREYRQFLGPPIHGHTLRMAR